MDTTLAIASKRDARRYHDTPLSDAVAAGILHAGRVTGSAKNRQARRFVVVRAGKEKAATMVTRPENVLGAALVIAIVVRGSAFSGFDAGRAAQNMMLWAWSEGVASCPNAPADAGGLKRLLDLPEAEAVAALLSFGLPRYHAGPDRRSVEEWLSAADRMALEEVVDYR